MKQYVYQIEGALSSEQAGTIREALPPMDGVVSVELHPSDGEHRGYVTVDWTSAPLEAALTAWEDAIADLLGRYADAALVRPALNDRYVVDVPVRPKRQVSLGAAISTVITAVVLAVLLTFAIGTSFIGKEAGTASPDAGNSRFEQLDTLDRIFRSLSPLELDDQQMLETVLKAYVASTGDRYAAYFTDEEYEAYKESNSGSMVGIGVRVSESTVTVNGTAYTAITITDVFPDSPAEKAGVQRGDAIMYIGSGDGRVMVHTEGYSEAVKRLSGEAGTVAEFEVFRLSESELSGYESVTISVERQKIETRSVFYRACATDASVGIISIVSFDSTTPGQFAAAVDALKAEGCEQFIFDLRDNPGGQLDSVVDVLTYFSRVGDTVITVKENSRTTVTTISDSVNKETGKILTGSGTLEPSDIGKYRNLTFTVLVNENTASAAELFSAYMRDYELGTLVGVKTFGKGTIQAFQSLKPYGCGGVLKLTYGHYYPPSGEGYDGIGIEPHVPVELSEEAKNYPSIRLVPDDKDNQLQKAVEVLHGLAS